MNTLADLEAKLAVGAAFTREDADRVAACTDLITVGTLGEGARKARHGNRVTYGRVFEVAGEPPAGGFGAAGEVRIVEAPATADHACAIVRRTALLAHGVPLIGFSLADLVELVNGDHMALMELARALHREGLQAVAEVPVDRLGDLENATEIVRAVVHGGLGAWRATVQRADGPARLDIIARAAAIGRDTGAFKAFAPLPRIDAADAPSTGYDDVRTVAVARLMCAHIASIQVDWPLYGPKLAQVAIAYGADDIDGISAEETSALGPRRAPKEDIERQIRAAFAEPVERDGRYAPRS